MRGVLSLLQGRRGLYLAAFLSDLFNGTGHFAVPLLAIGLGASEFELGLLGTAGMVYFFGSVGMGALSDRWGRKGLVLLACALLAGIYPLLGAMRSFGTLLVMNCIRWGSVGLFWPPLMAWVGEQRGEGSLLRSIGILNVCWSIGFGVAPLVGGVTAQWSLWAPLIIASVGMCLAGVTLLMTREESQWRRESRRLESVQPLGRTFLFMAWVGNFCMVFASALSRILLPKVTTEMGISTIVLGGVLASVGIARTLMFVVAGRFTGWAYKLWPLVMVYCGAMAGMLLVFWSWNPAVWLVGFTLLGLGIGLTYHSSLFYSLAYSPARMGLRAGLHEGILGSAGWLGPLLGGFVAKVTGSMKSPWLLAAGLPCVAVIISLFLYIGSAGRRVVAHRGGKR